MLTVNPPQLMNWPMAQFIIKAELMILAYRFICSDCCRLASWVMEHLLQVVRNE